jgi:hypothetical protein
MSGPHILLGFLYRLCGLALFGFVAILLVGPVVAVVAVLASFALIGFLFWLPIRLFLIRKPIDWARAKEKGRRYGGMVVAGCSRIRAFLPANEAILEKSRHAGLFVAVFFREVICGAVLGSMLGSIRATQGAFELWPIILGLCLGAGIGACVALAGALRAHRPKAALVPEHVD